MSVAVEWPAGSPAQPASGRHLALVPPLDAAPEPRTRLTRRGRLLRALLLFVLLMIGVLRFVDPAPTRPDLSVDHATTVRSGQTLTDVAMAELPAIDVREGIRRIRIVNGLQGTGLYPGQTLQIPVNR